MLISKRKYYRNFYLMMMVAGLFIFISGSVANQYLLHINMIDKICRYAIIMEAVIVGIVMVVILLKYKGIKKHDKQQAVNTFD